MLLWPRGIPPGPIKSSGFVPGGCQVLPPSSERWMICPNQPLVWDAKMRFGSAGEPLRWYISQPAKCGPLTSQFWRLPSAVRMNAPFFVPTRTLIVLIFSSFFLFAANYCPLFHNGFQGRQSLLKLPAHHLVAVHEQAE